MATKLNVSRQAVSKWEAGVIPDVDNVVRIANFFDCSLDYLMNDDISEMKGDNNIIEQDISIKKQKLKLTKNRIIKIAAALPVFLLIVLWTISKMVEFPITHQDYGSGNFYTGFLGFVDYYRLSGVLHLCIAIWLTTIVTHAVWRLYTNPRKTGVRIGKKFLCIYLIRFVLIIVGTGLLIYGFSNPWKFNWTIQTGLVLAIYFIAVAVLSLAINYFAEKE